MTTHAIALMSGRKIVWKGPEHDHNLKLILSESPSTPRAPHGHQTLISLENLSVCLPRARSLPGRGSMKNQTCI